MFRTTAYVPDVEKAIAEEMPIKINCQKCGFTFHGTAGRKLNTCSKCGLRYELHMQQSTDGTVSVEMVMA